MIRNIPIIPRLISRNIRNFSIYDIQERFEEPSPKHPILNTFFIIPEFERIPCDTCTCETKEDCSFNDGSKSKTNALTED